MSKEKLIPDLRFPEFKNEGEWTETILGSVVEMKGRIGYRGYTTEDIVDKGKGAITLSPSNFKENGQLNFDKCTYISWAKYNESPEIQLEEGQTVLVKTASVGKTAYVDKLPEKATVNPQIVVLKPKTIHNRFLSFTVSHQNSQTQIRNNVGAGAIPNISQEIISKIKILIPPDKERKEQQKIATCLSSLDEVIAAQSQKLDLLKDHKKSLMQNLFPQEGEKVPKYRFEEFEKDGEWVETKLGDSAIFINGKAYKQEELLETGKYRVLRVGNFFTNKNWYYSDLELEEDKYCEDGDLLYAWSASFGPRVWRGEKVIYHYHIWKVLPAESISNDFLFVLLDKETEQMKTQNANGFALLHITKGTIESWECSIPESKLEQQKIASCLSSLDTLITAQAEKIEQLKLHKKGLMQGLFPKIND